MPLLLLLLLAAPFLADASSCPFAGNNLPSPTSLFRAHMPKPRREFQGLDMAQMSVVLNKALAAYPSVQMKDCSEFSLDELAEVQFEIVKSAHPQFQKLYAARKDRRTMKVNSVDEFMEREVLQRKALREFPELTQLTRDGKCHETIMW